MADFTLYQQALKQYQKQENNNMNLETDCIHSSFVEDKGTIVCVDCGEEMQTTVTNCEKDWRTSSESKSVKDIDRVQMRKVDDRSIFRDVENLSISESIVAKANKIYLDVTKGNIFRGNSRRAIVFASIFHAFKLSGVPQTHDSLMKIFGIERKIGLKGLKYVNIYAPKDSELRTTYIAPESLIREIMTQFSASKNQIQEVIEIYNQIRDISSKINRSRPQSTASGLVFYWIRLNKKNITLKEFAKKVSLSELTISKIAKEIAEIRKTPGVV